MRLAFLHALSALLLATAPQATAPQSVQPISRVREMGTSLPGTRVVVRGTVTRYRTGRSIHVRDTTASIFVDTEGTDMIAPGDLVEVTGVAGTDENAPLIDKATYRKIGSGEPPLPDVVPVRELTLGRHDAELVSVDGTLLRIDATRFEDAFIIQSGDVEFTAWLLRDAAGTARLIKPGTQVRVAGAASILLMNHQPKGFELLMRTGADVVVLQLPSWWTSRRVGNAAVALAGVIALLLTYVFLLRRQVGRQTAAIAERLRAESDLTEKYRQAQKMEAIGRLAGGIAHDFNNIMTVVLGHSEMLALELKDHPELSASVAEIRHAAERAAGLTRQLLAFGRRQKLQPSPVELNAVIRDMAPLFARVLGGDIKVDAEPASEPVTILSDRAQLEQALLNLAVNARDAMPDGGCLTLSTSRRQDGDGPLKGVLTVADTGTGIPADAQAHVFDPFFTTKDVGAGSGLGLAMVYGFVQQSGGAIRFATSAGHGTTFELTFPLTPGNGDTHRFANSEKL